MPLLTSPIDGSPMKQVHRFGIEIDVCPTSGGIWLDKGELEKLMILLREESGTELSGKPVRHRLHDDDRDDDDDDDYYKRGKHVRGEYSKRRESKMSRIMDIFDF